jgi:hypothetical protein
VRDGNPWRCGEAATNELRKLTTGRATTCEKRDTDSYGRTVAVFSNGSVDLAAELTRAGLALAYREFSDDYVDEENDAEAARRGAWAGTFTNPWDARRGRDTQPPSDDSDGVSQCRGTGIKATSAGTAATGSITCLAHAITKKRSLTSPRASAGSARRTRPAERDGARRAANPAAGVACSPRT